MELDQLFDKAIKLIPLNTEEGLELYSRAPLAELMFVGNKIRQLYNGSNSVGWMIDRNINLTNICFSQCAFCNFCRNKKSEDAYVTTTEEYVRKIDEMYSLGGDQLLLQGGMNPQLGIDFYTELFRNLKRLYPTLKLHALGPPEIVYLARKERLSYSEVLSQLCKAGLDSLPGAGAEILSDRVRKIVSPAKATSEEWLEVMKEAHIMNLPTSATMMYGHIETIRERIEHLIKLRDLQALKSQDHYGFITFIPWPFQDQSTVLRIKHGITSSYNGPDYLRMIAISRIILNNIRNIQASILTVGKEIGMLSLHAGANDLGSIIIPRRRNQKYEFIDTTP
jgi:cyclic dehypoxanthinyl futalosine synthase